MDKQRQVCPRQMMASLGPKFWAQNPRRRGISVSRELSALGGNSARDRGQFSTEQLAEEQPQSIESSPICRIAAFFMIAAVVRKTVISAFDQPPPF